MDYIGSKTKLNEWMFDIIIDSTGSPSENVFLDACCGSGAVSKYAIKKGYRIISNDLMKFPSVIVNGTIGLTKKQKKIAISEIRRFNSLNGLNGYFYKHFCDESIPSRKYFTAKNARLIDNVRKEINFIDDSKVKDYLLCCGLEAMSRVSNTTGVQAAFLKSFKERAKCDFQMKEEETFDGNAKAFCMNIFSLLKDEKFTKKYKEDILYIDPPYNQRQYGPNYHLYETFVRNDNPIPIGKTGLRNWKEECHSKFCVKNSCLNFLKDMVEATRAKFVFISYNSDGLINKEKMIEEFPNVKVHERVQRRYRSDTSDNRKYNVDDLFEYLFEIRK